MNAVNAEQPTQNHWYNLGRALEHVAQEDPWALSPPRIAPTTSGGSELSLEANGPINCAQWGMIPHVHTTHTETSLHIDSYGPAICELSWPVATNATLLRVEPTLLGATNETGPLAAEASDRVISCSSLSAAHASTRLVANETQLLRSEALILATQTSGDTRDAPAYLTLEAMRWIVARGVEHLLVDVPSVDRTDDGGELLCHREFWQLDARGPRSQRATITEQISVPAELRAGSYFLLLQPLLAQTDASPSSPLIRRRYPPKEATK